MNFDVGRCNSSGGVGAQVCLFLLSRSSVFYLIFSSCLHGLLYRYIGSF